MLQKQKTYQFWNAVNTDTGIASQFWNSSTVRGARMKTKAIVEKARQTKGES
jgi:hypothetical protein